MRDQTWNERREYGGSAILFLSRALERFSGGRPVALAITIG
jgi:hypothetical protein